jgi:hypothetical protein
MPISVNIWYKIRGYLAAGLALIACPCHFVLVLPLLLSVTAGKALGAFLEQNYGFIIAVSIIVFISGLVLALRWLRNDISEDGTLSSKQARRLLKRLPHVRSLQQNNWVSFGKIPSKMEKEKNP